MKNRELTNKLLLEEMQNFPLRKFLKADGSVNTRKIKLMHKDFQQDALDMIFLSKAIDRHGQFFGYEEMSFKTMTQQVKIYCPDCDSYFMQIARDHIAGSGCPNCKHKVITRKTEVGDFTVPCKFHRWNVVPGEYIEFYTSRGEVLKISLV